MAQVSKARRSFAARLHRRDLDQDEYDRLYGWAPRGRRLINKVPHGHWKTSTFLTALRCDRVEALCLLDGPINGERFLAYVTKFLTPTLKPDDIVVADNLGSHKGKAAQKAIRSAGARLLFLPQIFARPQSHRAGSSPN
jgi:hypothetical protein